jgi:hypothetical protein
MSRKLKILMDPAKPTRKRIRAELITQELRMRKQWVMWCWVRKKKWDKMPYGKDGTSDEWTDPKQWMTFDEALALATAEGSGYDGIGYVFSPDDPYFGVDYDDALDENGQLRPEIQPHVSLFATYTEESPTGTGVKLIGRGHTRNATTTEAAIGDIGFENYDSGRFFTITGEAVPGTPTTIEDRQGQLDAILELLGIRKSSTTEDAGPEVARNGEPLADFLTKALAIFAHLYPDPSHRHDNFRLPLARVLLDAGATKQQAEDFAMRLAAAAGDGDAKDLIKAIGTTEERTQKDDPRKGWPTLERHLIEFNHAKYPPEIAQASLAQARVLLRDAYRGDESFSVPAEKSWPLPPASEAYYGLAGDVVRLLGPASEADPVAILTQLLAGFGSIVGRSPYFQVEDDRHYGNEFFCLVGKTSRGRKGTSWGRTLPLLEAADPGWVKDRIVGGMSSGEGLIWAVRDPVFKMERIKEKGSVRYERVQCDAGVTDKRLLIFESEFASVLRRAEQQGSSLTAVIRQMWDSGNLRTLTKNDPNVATDAHGSIIAHSTAEELRRYLTATEMANGFANRFCWPCVRRSKLLPKGAKIDKSAYDKLTARVVETIAEAKAFTEVTRCDEAEELWVDAYPVLTAERYGLVGAMTARAEAHVVRLSLLYALLDKSNTIRAVHLKAALALWDYCERSVHYIFGDLLGDALADEILRLLRATPEGMTRLDISNAFSRNRSSGRIGAALALLADRKLARAEKRPTAGRPEERWFAESTELNSFNSFNSYFSAGKRDLDESPDAPFEASKSPAQKDELNELNELSPAPSPNLHTETEFVEDLSL